MRYLALVQTCGTSMYHSYVALVANSGLVFLLAVHQLISVTLVSNNLSSPFGYGVRTLPKNLKILPFCTCFCAVRFCQFLNKYRTDGHETWHAFLTGTHNAGITAQWKPSSLPGTSVRCGHSLRKNFF